MYKLVSLSRLSFKTRSQSRKLYPLNVSKRNMVHGYEIGFCFLIQTFDKIHLLFPILKSSIINTYKFPKEFNYYSLRSKFQKVYGWVSIYHIHLNSTRQISSVNYILLYNSQHSGIINNNIYMLNLICVSGLYCLGDLYHNIFPIKSSSLNNLCNWPITRLLKS